MSGNSKILLVDDKTANLLALESVLEPLDAEILKANSGNEALYLVLHHDFAVVLLDVQMPDMDGFETAELMHNSSKTRHIPIIFVTALNREEKYVMKGYEAGAVDYLSKPIDPEILLGKVKVFLELDRQKVYLQEINEKRQFETVQHL